MPTTRRNPAPDPRRNRYEDRTLFPEQSTRGFLEGGVATQEMLTKMVEGLTLEHSSP
jgi:hypothetical protein